MLSKGSFAPVGTFDPFLMTDPDALGSAFSFGAPSTASFDGFGPGDYSGGYTGAGDRVYWGPSGGSDVRPPPAVLNSNTNPIYSPHVGPGFVVDAVHAATLATTDSSGAPIKSTGPQPSARTGAVAPPVSEASAAASSVGADASTGAATATGGSGRSFMGSHSEDPGSSAGWGERSEMSGGNKLDAANDTASQTCRDRSRE